MIVVDAVVSIEVALMIIAYSAGSMVVHSSIF